MRVPRPRRSDLELARESAELWADDTREQSIGFMSRTFALTSLPYQQPSDDTLVWSRRNGDFLLKVTPGARVDNTSIGFPYGTVPRLLIAYVATEAVKRQKSGSTRIELPSSMAQFMHSLGMKPTGGKNGTIDRLRNQAERTFEATFTVRWEGDKYRDVGRKFTIAREWDLNWKPKARTENFIDLSAEFHEEVLSAPVPLDFDAFLSLGGSALRMDMLTWLSYRMSFLSKTVVIPWDSLRAQFGFQLSDDPKGRSKFKSLFVKNLPYVRNVYRKANVEPTKDGLKLHPSPTHVPFRGTRHLRSA